MLDNSFYADFYGEYYRFKEEDILPDWTLSDKVPDFVRRLYDKNIISAGTWRTGIGQPKVLSYTWDENALDDTVFPGDCIIQLSYMQRMTDDEIYVIPRKVFDSLFNFDEGEEQYEQE